MEFDANSSDVVDAKATRYFGKSAGGCSPEVTGSSPVGPTHQSRWSTPARSSVNSLDADTVHDNVTHPVSSTGEHLFHIQDVGGSTPPPGTGVDAKRRVTSPFKRRVRVRIPPGPLGPVAQLAEPFTYLPRNGSRRSNGIEALMVMHRVLTPVSRVQVLAVPLMEGGGQRCPTSLESWASLVAEGSTPSPSSHCRMVQLGAHLALNQEIGVRILVWQRSVRCEAEAYFGTWNSWNQRQAQLRQSGSRTDLVIVVSIGQHASPPRWKWEFESPRSHR